MSGIPDCIIPAAGLSSRMEQWKPGIPWKKRTVVEQVASQALEAGCRTIVAGGYRYDELKVLLEGVIDVLIVEVPDWRTGMDATIRGAFSYLESESAFVVPADMPLIASADYVRLAREWNGRCSRPVFDGIPGHPVLLGPEAVAKVGRSPAGIPLHSVLSGIGFERIPWDHPGVIRDLDTPEDFRELRP